MFKKYFSFRKNHYILSEKCSLSVIRLVKATIFFSLFLAKAIMSVASVGWLTRGSKKVKQSGHHSALWIESYSSVELSPNPFPFRLSLLRNKASYCFFLFHLHSYTWVLDHWVSAPFFLGFQICFCACINFSSSIRRSNHEFFHTPTQKCIGFYRFCSSICLCFELSSVQFFFFSLISLLASSN